MFLPLALVMTAGAVAIGIARRSGEKGFVIAAGLTPIGAFLTFMAYVGLTAYH